MEFIFDGYEEYHDFREAFSDYLHKLLGRQSLMPIALNESVNNAFKHSGKGNNIRVRIQCHTIARRRLIIRVRHNGRGIGADTCQTLRNGEEVLENFAAGNSGCGIYLIYQIADYVKYNRWGNELLMMKKLS